MLSPKAKHFKDSHLLVLLKCSFLGPCFRAMRFCPQAEKEATTQSLYEEAARIPAFQKDLQENGPEDGDAPQAVSGRDVFLAAMNAKPFCAECPPAPSSPS